MTRLEPRMTNDILFKLLFSRRPELLKRLVAELLGLEFESIGTFTIRNPEIPPEEIGEKFCRLDIAMTIDGMRVNLEIQVENQGDFIDRALYYWAREHSTALPEGGAYKDLPCTIVISILDFALFGDPEFYSDIRALEFTRHTLLTDKFNLRFFELPKLRKKISAENTLELWLNLFKAKTEEDLAKIKALEVPIMNQTIEAYRTVSVSPEFQEMERLRSKARHNEASALGHARREGEEEGLQKGRQEGRQEEKFKTARNLLGMGFPIDQIMQATDLSRGEIENLKH